LAAIGRSERGHRVRILYLEAGDARAGPQVRGPPGAKHPLADEAGTVLEGIEQDGSSCRA